VKKPFKPFGLMDDPDYVANVHPLGTLPGFKDGDSTILESSECTDTLQTRTSSLVAT
jgi:hypothetical protein